MAPGVSFPAEPGMPMKIEVSDSLEEVARKALEYAQGPRIAVSGGGTFAGLFRHWLPEMKRRAQAGTPPRFFPVDERRVPFTDPQSNWKTCYEELLLPAGLEAQKVHHAVSTSQYLALLEGEFKGGPVVFDQVFLGMGEDGHTASLFPGGAYLKDRKSVVLDVVGPKPPPERVTLGLKPLWDCKVLVAIALGESKAPMVRRLREADMTLPITMALAGHGNAVLLLDRAAAGN